MHQPLAGRRSRSLAPQTPRQRERARHSLGAILLHNQQRKRRNPGIEAFRASPQLWVLYWLEARHPRPPSRSYKVKRKNLLFNLLHQNPSSLSIWARAWGAPGGVCSGASGSTGGSPGQGPAASRGWRGFPTPARCLGAGVVLGGLGRGPAAPVSLGAWPPSHSAVRLQVAVLQDTCPARPGTCSLRREARPANSPKQALVGRQKLILGQDGARGVCGAGSEWLGQKVKDMVLLLQK